MRSTSKRTNLIVFAVLASFVVLTVSGGAKTSAASASGSQWDTVPACHTAWVFDHQKMASYVPTVHSAADNLQNAQALLAQVQDAYNWKSCAAALRHAGNAALEKEAQRTVSDICAGGQGTHGIFQRSPKELTSETCKP